MDRNQPVYKYMKRRHARSFFKEGLIRIGTLYDFRKEEKHGTEIGDKDEGTKTLTTEGYHLVDTADPNTIPSWLNEHFFSNIKLQEGARLQLHAKDGVRLRLTVPDRYVFCASYEVDDALIKNGEYECCVKINNPQGFFGALSQKLKYKAKWLGYGKCVYRPRLMLGHEDVGLEPALIKENRHAYQKEIRGLWAPAAAEIVPMIIKAKKARFYCEFMKEIT